MASMSDDRGRFWKGHALGNDYIVLATGEAPGAGVVRGLCDRHRGVGADGVLVAGTAADPVTLRIFNPDGGEAEKSGNGLRIFAAWLHHRGLVGAERFRVALRAETVEMEVEGASADGTRVVRVDMGAASFQAGDVHYTGAEPTAEVMGDALDVASETVRIHLVSMGNPHCVVFVDEPGRPLERERLARVGPALQSLPAFAQGINVQLARVVTPDTIEALVWERGAGETLASGSSACAVAAAAVRSGRLEGRRLRVRMPGGGLDVRIDDGWRVRLTGAAQIVYEGQVPAGVLSAWREGGASEQAREEAREEPWSP
jgi:diaminopimelate epimerase